MVIGSDRKLVVLRACILLHIALDSSSQWFFKQKKNSQPICFFCEMKMCNRQCLKGDYCSLLLPLRRQQNQRANWPISSSELKLVQKILPFPTLWTLRKRLRDILAILQCLKVHDFHLSCVTIGNIGKICRQLLVASSKSNNSHGHKLTPTMLTYSHRVNRIAQCTTHRYQK